MNTATPAQPGDDASTRATDPRDAPSPDDRSDGHDIADRVAASDPFNSEDLLPLPQERNDAPVDRGDIIGESLRWLSGWSLRFLIIAVAAFVVWMGLGKVWVALLPAFLAMIVCTVLWPPVSWLHRHGVPRILAVVLSMLGAVLVVGGVIAGIAPSVVSQTDELARSFTAGLYSIQDWIQGPPLNLEDSQLNTAINEATNWLQNQASTIAGSVVGGISTASSILVTVGVVLVLTFFFLKDGADFLPWGRRVLGRRLGWHLTEVLTRSWTTLSGYIRAQAAVSFIDAIFIGGGLVLLNVPLALALGVLTFFAGFIPIVGAVVAGAVAVIVALVAKGFTTALIVLVLVIAVQQIEGNVLSPMLQSKAMNLHPVIVLLSVTVGSGLFGILGAFLAVPIAAIVAVWFRYFGDLTDLRTGEKTVQDIEFATEAGAETGRENEAAGLKWRQRLEAERQRLFGGDQGDTNTDADGNGSESAAAGRSKAATEGPITDILARLFHRDGSGPESKS